MKQKYKDNFKKVGLFKTIKACIKGLYYGVSLQDIVCNILWNHSNYTVVRRGSICYLGSDGTVKFYKVGTKEHKQLVDSKFAKWYYPLVGN